MVQNQNQEHEDSWMNLQAVQMMRMLVETDELVATLEEDSYSGPCV